MLYLLRKLYNEREVIMNVRLSQKGWVVIPAALREKYGLKPGADVQVVDYGGVLALVPAFKDPITDGAGLLKGADSLTLAIVEDHRLEREGE
jgi:AbrB family looped-hinge helix DNA binding protein